MPGSITTYSYCAFNPTGVNTGRGACGTHREIVCALLRWGFEETGELWAQHEGFEKQTYHSYDSSWTLSERDQDACGFLYRTLTRYGYRLYRDVG